MALNARLLGLEPEVVEEIPSSADPARIRRLEASGVRVYLGDGPGSGLRYLEDKGVLLPSPGVPESAPLVSSALESGIPVWSEIEFGWRIFRSRGGARVIAVTGTNGKTTVTTLTSAILDAAGFDVRACGNIGYTFTEAALESCADTVLVAEVSSFQARFCETFSADVAVLTNFAPDHLDWHPDTASYARAKGRLFDLQLAGAKAVFNADDPMAVEIVDTWARDGVERVPFTKSDPGVGLAGVDESGTLTGPAGEKAVRVSDLWSPGIAPVEDALAAVSAASCMGAGEEAMARAIREFKGLPHRLEVVEVVGGVAYVDDSKATNPHAAAYALTAFDSVILLVGGRNKGLDLSEVVAIEGVANRLKFCIGFGEAGAEGVEALASAGVGGVSVSTLEEAVAAASSRARPGDTVLLSPGCASFDQFDDYAQRGVAFAEAVRRLNSRSADGRGHMTSE